MSSSYTASRIREGERKAEAVIVPEAAVTHISWGRGPVCEIYPLTLFLDKMVKFVLFV